MIHFLSRSCGASSVVRERAWPAGGAEKRIKRLNQVESKAREEVLSWKLVSRTVITDHCGVAAWNHEV
jgi:hypothetical protein